MNSQELIAKLREFIELLEAQVAGKQLERRLFDGSWISDRLCASDIRNVFERIESGNTPHAWRIKPEPKVVYLNEVDGTGIFAGYAYQTKHDAEFFKHADPPKITRTAIRYVEAPE